MLAAREYGRARTLRLAADGVADSRNIFLRLLPAFAGADDQELIPAEAADRPFGGKGLAQGIGNGTDGEVSLQMPETVVDDLHAVDVREEQHGIPACPPVLLKQRRGELLQAQPVVKTRQGIARI
jgi:hypothetical protein